MLLSQRGVEFIQRLCCTTIKHIDEKKLQNLKVDCSKKKNLQLDFILGDQKCCIKHIDEKKLIHSHQGRISLNNAELL